MNFTNDRKELDTINKIGKRAEKLDLGTTLDVMMDVDSCHSNGCPLRLDDLLNADDQNFAHDVVGINRHLDRRTGKLTAVFVPRFAKHEVTDVTKEFQTVKPGQHITCEVCEVELPVGTKYAIDGYSNNPRCEDCEPIPRALEDEIDEKAEREEQP